MLNNWKKIGFVTLTASTLLLTACGEGTANDDDLVDGDEVELVYVAWDNLIASTNVVGTILEDIGYDVTLSNVDNAVMWQAIATGEADITVGGSLPTIHGAQYEEHGDDMVYVNTNLEGQMNGLAVPEYMEVDSIADLTDEANQEITGIEAGAGIMEATDQAFEDYENLEDWELISSSSGAMASELQSAIENEEEIVVTGWVPHWKFQSLDIKMLEDPEYSFGEEQFTNTFVREGFEEDHQVAYSVLENFEWEIEIVESIMLDIQEGAEPEDAARDWVDENQEMVEEWTADAEEAAEQ